MNKCTKLEGKEERDRASRSDVEKKLQQTKSGPREEKPSHQGPADQGPEASTENDKTTRCSARESRK